MKRIVVLLFLLSTFAVANSQPQFYERTYGLGRGVMIDRALNGNFIIGANTEVYPNNQAFYFLIDENGDTLRTMSCPGLNLNCIRQISEGGFVLMGDTGIYPNKLAIVYKTDTIGTIIWNSAYPSDEWGTWGSCVAPNYDNGYYISLVDDGAGSDNTYYVVKTDSTGNNLDTAIVQSPESSFLQNPNSMLLTPDSGVVVATSVPVFGLTRIIKFDAGLNTEWNKVYNDTAGVLELNGNSIIRLNSNAYLISGYTTPIGGGPGACGYLLKTDLNGDSIWSKQYCFSNHSARFVSAAENANGDFYIAGEYSDSLQRSILLVKANSLGDTLWTRIFPGMGYAFPKCLILDNDQNPMVVGYTKDTVSNQEFIYLIKTDTSGLISALESNYSESELQLNLFPNPVHSVLTVSCSNIKGKSFSLSLRNVIGQLLFSKQEKNGNPNFEVKIDLADLPSGLYFLEAWVDGRRTISRVMKN
jgi:hypothetical protein